MKSLSRISCLIALAAFAASAGGCATAPPLQGAWVVESYSGTAPDPHAPPAVPEPGRSVKILTAQRFAFGQTGQDGRAQFGGGTWAFQDGVYSETIDYHWLPDYVGQTIRFNCRVEGDLWFHDARNDHGTGWGIHEVWRRVPERVRPPDWAGPD